MATIGLYGVFYKKCRKENGVCVGYDGTVKMMGKAIKAGFTPKTTDENPLYANNAAAESDNSSGHGGSLALTLDRMTLETSADLYGTQVEEVEVEVDGEVHKGQEISYKGDEVSCPVGTAYILLGQEDGVRNHEAVFYREATYTRPTEEASTMGEKIEWQTPSISATVVGKQGDGAERWYRKARFDNQRAAIAYIFKLLNEPFDDATAASVEEMLNDGEEDA